MSAPTVGALFAGYDGIGMGLQKVIPHRVAWFSENEPAPSRILAHHWPDVPNHGDMTSIDWAAVEPVDVITGGFPCQDLSLAGRRAGMAEGTRSGLWSHMAAAIETIRPRLVVAENVRGLLSGKAHSNVEQCPGCLDGARLGHIRALGVVLGDLARLGYDAQWLGLRASDVGAPHQRFRVFVVAHLARTENADGATGGERRVAASRQAEGGRARPDAGRRDRVLAPDARSSGLDGWPSGPDAGGLEAVGREAFDHPGDGPAPCVNWGQFAPAVARWEPIVGRPAPSPTEAGARGGQRLSPAFVEWMMGLPAGHVTAPAIGLTRAQQLKALGNGVVPQQAEAAIRHLLTVAEAA